MKLIPSAKNAKIKDGFLCIKPCFSVQDGLFENVMRAFSQTSDKLFGIEFYPLDIEVTDESLYTPLTEEQKNMIVSNGKDLPPLPGEIRSDKGLFIKTDPALSDGEYRLTADNICVITISGEAGLQNALSTFIQLSSRTCDNYIKLPRCEINDRPDCDFRALSVDVARRWHPVDFLYSYAELCSMFKINRMIIHFTDDESYTLPSDAFPKLPTKNRHYTKAELTALDEFARDRGVMLIPEIDMPGHCAQFLLKYPEIFGTYGIMEASEEAFGALRTIYAEAAELFSHSDYIHVGGDEAVLGRWDDSEKTKAYMEKNGIPDFVSLMGHYAGRVCDDILALGKTPIIWEGFRKESNHLISKDVLVIAWESHYQLAPELVEAGFEILNASWKPLYVLAPWQKWSSEEILSWDRFTLDHWWEGSAAFKNKIILPKNAPVRGGIMCAWGDYLKGYESSRLACQLERASLIPRLSAMAEKLWSTDSTLSASEFDAALENCRGKLDIIYGQNSFRGKL